MVDILLSLHKFTSVSSMSLYYADKDNILPVKFCTVLITLSNPKPKKNFHTS